jgi:hypothetical protein
MSEPLADDGKCKKAQFEGRFWEHFRDPCTTLLRAVSHSLGHAEGTKLDGCEVLQVGPR